MKISKKDYKKLMLLLDILEVELNNIAKAVGHVDSKEYLRIKREDALRQKFISGKLYGASAMRSM